MTQQGSTTKAPTGRAELAVRITYSPWAECMAVGCGWNRPAGRTTRSAAQQHVKATGHEVVVVIEDRSLYQPKAAKQVQS